MPSDFSLPSMGEAIQGFEANLNASLAKAMAYRDQVLTLFDRIPVNSTQETLAPSFKKILEDAENTVLDAISSLDGARKELLEQEKLVDHLADYFIVAIVGEVNSGKSTFANALVEIFRTGLNRKVACFRLEEPTLEKTWADLVRDGDYLHGAWVRGQLRGDDQHRLWEALKRESFRPSATLAQELAANTGLTLARVPVAGDYRDTPIPTFEIDPLEKTLEIQGFRSGGICFLDAPGLASGNPFARERAERIWASADVLVFMGTRTTPIAQAHLQQFKDLKVSPKSMLFCIAACDAYEEDEVDGEVVESRRFAEEEVAIQTDYVLKILGETGLEASLAQGRIYGLSSKLFNDRGRSKSIEEGITRGHFEPFLEAVSTTLAQDGLRLKIQAPLRRAKKIAEQVLDTLQARFVELEDLRERQAQGRIQDSHALIEAFRSRAKTRLADLYQEAFIEAKKGLSRDRSSMNVRVEAKKIERCLLDTLNEVGKEFRPHFLKAIEGMKTTPLIAVAQENWKQVTEKRKRTFHYKEETKTGRAIGAIVGGILGWFVNPFASAAGVTLGSWVGSKFDGEVERSEQVVENYTREVRQGDNLTEVSARMADHQQRAIQEVAGRLEVACGRMADQLLQVLDAHLGVLRTRIMHAQALNEEVRKQIS